MGTTNLNLLLDVDFNREVGKEAAKYWKKEEGNLAALIDACDRMEPEEIKELGRKAKERIRSHYSWESIASQYEEEFLAFLKDKNEDEDEESDQS